MHRRASVSTWLMHSLCLARGEAVSSCHATRSLHQLQHSALRLWVVCIYLLCCSVYVRCLIPVCCLTTGRMTQDDMFSSDLSDSELRQQLGHVSVPCLALFSLGTDCICRAVTDACTYRRRVRAIQCGQAGPGGATHVCPQQRQQWRWRRRR